MHIEVSANGIKVTPAMREHVQHRLHLALGRFATRIDGVAVRLTDVNGPRGGVDVHCRMQVQGKDTEGLWTTALAVNPEKAINEATVRLQRAIKRAIERVEERVRRRAIRRPPLL